MYVVDTITRCQMCVIDDDKIDDIQLSFFSYFSFFLSPNHTHTHILFKFIIQRPLKTMMMMI